jgi:hypothetical protein
MDLPRHDLKERVNWVIAHPASSLQEFVVDSVTDSGTKCRGMDLMPRRHYGPKGKARKQLLFQKKRILPLTLIQIKARPGPA